MTTLAMGYAIVWAAVTGYVAWLGAQQRMLEQRVQDLEAKQRGPRQDEESPAARAA